MSNDVGAHGQRRNLPGASLAKTEKQSDWKP